MQMNRQMKRRNERQQRNDQRKHFDIAVASRDYEQEQTPGQGNKSDQRKNVWIEAGGIHLTPIQTM
jgi:hypothetical protein